MTTAPPPRATTFLSPPARTTVEVVLALAAREVVAAAEVVAAREVVEVALAAREVAEATADETAEDREEARLVVVLEDWAVTPTASTATARMFLMETIVAVVVIKEDEIEVEVEVGEDGVTRDRLRTSEDGGRENERTCFCLLLLCGRRKEGTRRVAQTGVALQPVLYTPDKEEQRRVRGQVREREPPAGVEYLPTPLALHAIWLAKGLWYGNH